MRINSISSSGIYAAKAVSMKAMKSEAAIIRDFKNFMKSNNLVLTATLTPAKSGFVHEIELAKKQGYNLTPVTDEDLYSVKSCGNSLNEAIVDMAKSYRGKEVYINSGNIEQFTIPKFL